MYLDDHDKQQWLVNQDETAIMQQPSVIAIAILMMKTITYKFSYCISYCIIEMMFHHRHYFYYYYCYFKLISREREAREETGQQKRFTRLE